MEHPLLNTLIVKNVLKFSTLKDLPLHRLVCKTWFEGSLQRWRSMATLSVLQERIRGRRIERRQKGKPNPHIITVPEETGITLEELQKILFGNEDENFISREFLQLDLKPFAKYRLKQWKIRQNEPETVNVNDSDSEDSYFDLFDTNKPLVKTNLEECTEEQLISGAQAFPEFWRKLGPLMKQLHLDKVNFIFTELPTPLLLIIFHHTPNLQILRLDQDRFLGPDGRDRWGKFILDHLRIDPKPQLTELVIGSRIPFDPEQFLSFFPNLQNYTFENCTSKSLFRTMSFLQNNIANEIKFPLRHLTIHHGGAGSDKWALEEELQNDYYKDINVAERMFPLESLDLGTSSTYPLFVRHFLDCLSYTLATYSSVSSLETLKIHMSPFAEPTRKLQLSCTMQFVKHLELLGNSFASLSFLRWMPNLESLKVHISCFKKWQEFPQLRVETKPSQRRFIKVFKDDVVKNATSDGMKDFVAEKLKRFYIDYEFGLDSLKTLGRWMPHLIEFQTILNNESLKGVCQQWKNLGKLELLYGSAVDDEGIVENLKLMKNLRTFKLKTYCGQAKLGNVSATEGFLKMRQLQNLEICVSKKMTVDVEMQLKTKIWHAMIIRNYGDNEQSHLTYGKCCKRLQFLYESVEGAKPPDTTKVELRRSKRSK